MLSINQNENTELLTQDVTYFESLKLMARPTKEIDNWKKMTSFPAVYKTLTSILSKRIDPFFETDIIKCCQKFLTAEKIIC